VPHQQNRRSDGPPVLSSPMLRDKKYGWNSDQVRSHNGAAAVPGRNWTDRILAVGAVALAVAASSTPVHAQEYPWCVSREGSLYCFYKTEQQCKWTASSMSGCEKNPRLLFPEKPRDSYPNPVNHTR
jgi:hypothetical protein